MFWGTRTSETGGQVGIAFESVFSVSETKHGTRIVLDERDDETGKRIVVFVREPFDQYRRACDAWWSVHRKIADRSWVNRLTELDPEPNQDEEIPF